jgi:hypothetical protein
MYPMAQSSLLDFFSEETRISGSDLPILLVIGLCYAVYRLLISELILKPLSHFVTHHDPEKQKSQRSKFVHRSFDMLHYITVASIGLIAASLRPYGRCPFIFHGCEKYSGQTEGGYVCSRMEKLYFFGFMGYYISDVPWIWTMSDVKMLLFHHIVSFSLMFCGVRAARPVITFSCNLLHDVVDVLLYTGKVLNYVNLKLLSDIVLLTFAGTFLWLRLINFGTIIYVFWFKDVGEQRGNVAEYQACRILVFGLLICHVIWFSMILKAFIKMMFKGRTEIRDTRSDAGEKVKHDSNGTISYVVSVSFGQVGGFNSWNAGTVQKEGTHSIN